MCRFKPVSGLNNKIPGFGNMPFFRMRLPDTHSENHLPVQFCMCKKALPVLFTSFINFILN
jgi:hypothetical protein